MARRIVSRWSVLAALGCLAASILSVVQADEPTGAPAAPADAPQLVQAALEAELAGDAARRAELLAQAAAADADHAPARWQSGQVKFEGKWRPVEEIAKTVQADPRWREYDELRQSLAGTPQDHEDVARWCYRQGLENEERYHWLRVIAADPRHQFARDRLKVRKYQGGLYTQEQIAAHEEQVKQSQANFEKFKPIFSALCRRVAGPNASDRESALNELRRVSDPEAIEALEFVIHRESRKVPDELARELYLAFIAALANVPEYDATARLLNYSVFAVDPAVRTAAAQALKPRPVTDYVPQLMAALTAPIEANIDAFTSADGTVLYVETLYQRGPVADLAVARSRDFVTVAVPNRRGQLPRAPRVARQVEANERIAQSHVAAARQRVAAANIQANVRNTRIREVLQQAVGLDLGPDPQTYWDSWTSYNELYEPEHPTFTYADDYTYVCPVRTMSCFMAGTPVWTQAGPKPINQIVAGDLVLSQNPRTGELGYRAVLETTIRPPSRMIELSVEGDSVTTTLGHRFWLDGRGWEMAKFLPIEQPLRMLTGSTPIQATELLEASESTEAYNLVVDEFHTYFVGQSKLLVHDNSCPQPIAGPAPGMKRLRGDSSEALAAN